MGIELVGQIGLGDTNNRRDGPGEMGDALPFLDLGTGRSAQMIAAGRPHTCAVLDNGRNDTQAPAERRGPVPGHR